MLEPIYAPATEELTKTCGTPRNEVSTSDKANTGAIYRRKRIAARLGSRYRAVVQ
jgi:hypothetical protein